MKKILMGLIIIPVTIPFIMCGFIFQIILEAFHGGRELYIEIVRKI